MDAIQTKQEQSSYYVPAKGASEEVTNEAPEMGDLAAGLADLKGVSDHIISPFTTDRP